METDSSDDEIIRTGRGSSGKTVRDKQLRSKANSGGRNPIKEVKSSAPMKRLKKSQVTKKRKPGATTSTRKRTVNRRVLKDIYIVETIEGKKEVDGEPYYLVKWEDYSKEHNSWEPASNLFGCKEMIKEYERKRREEEKERFEIVDGEIVQVDAAVNLARETVKRYGVLTEWPLNEKPQKVEGVLDVTNKELVYVVRTIGDGGSSRSESPERSKMIMVRGDSFRRLFPELVIKFYERRILWNDY